MSADDTFLLTDVHITFIQTTGNEHSQNRRTFVPANGSEFYASVAKCHNIVNKAVFTCHYHNFLLFPVAVSWFQYRV